MNKTRNKVRQIQVTFISVGYLIVSKQIKHRQNSAYPVAGYRIVNCPDRLGRSDEFVDNSTEVNCLEITGYRINYSTRTSNQAWLQGLDAGTYCK
jgi:hypothetical protein